MVKLFRLFAKIRGGSAMWTDSSPASAIINAEFFDSSPILVNADFGQLTLTGFEPTVSISSGSPFTLVDSTEFNGDINGGTTATIDTTGATLLITSVHYYAFGGTPTLSDSKSNTWIPLTAYQDAIPDSVVRLYYCISPTVGSGHDFTIGGSGTYSGIRVLAFSSATTPIYDSQNGSNANALTIQPGIINPSNSNNLFVAAATFYADPTPMSIDSSFTIDSYTGNGANSYGAVIAYKVNTSSSSENPTFTGTGSSFFSAGAIANFYVTGGGGGGTSVSTNVGQLILTGFAPTINATNNQNVLSGVGALTLNGFAPVIASKINTGLGQLTLNGFSPSINISVVASTQTGQAILTGFVPTVVATANITLNIGLGQLTLSGFAPTVAVSNNIRVSVGLGQLTLNGFSPTVNISQSAVTSTGELLLNGFEPTIVTTDNIIVTAGVGQLLVNGFEPSAIVNTSVVTNTGELILIGFEPTIIVLANTVLYPSFGELLLVGYSPRIRTTTKTQVIQPEVNESSIINQDTLGSSIISDGVNASSVIVIDNQGSSIIKNDTNNSSIIDI
jgi:hypothetical protein